MHQHGAFFMPKSLFGHPTEGVFFMQKMKGEMHMTNWKHWLKAAGVRAIKTVAQTAVATIGTSAVLGAVDWIAVGSAAVLAGILSLLTSLAGLPEVKTNEEGE